MAARADQRQAPHVTGGAKTSREQRRGPRPPAQGKGPDPVATEPASTNGVGGSREGENSGARESTVNPLRRRDTSVSRHSVSISPDRPSLPMPGKGQPDPQTAHGLILTALLRSGVSMRPSEVAQYSGLEVGEVEVALRVLEADGCVRATTWKAEL